MDKLSPVTPVMVLARFQQSCVTHVKVLVLQNKKNLSQYTSLPVYKQVNHFVYKDEVRLRRVLEILLVIYIYEYMLKQIRCLQKRKALYI